MRLRELIREDIYRYIILPENEGKASILRIIITLYDKEELWATIVYRLWHWAFTQVKPSIFKKILMILIDFLSKIIRILTGIVFPFDAIIGKGLYIAHYPVIIGPAVMGEYCNVSYNSLIGFGGREGKSGRPEIGNRVFVGPGAVIIGKIKVGNNVAIGANAVVTKDIPDNAVVAGIPAKIINYEGSADYIKIKKAWRIND